MHPASLDANGVIVGFHYHDGCLEGVLVHDTVAYLSLRSATGDRRVLVLRGLSDMRIDGFRPGNIILNMCVFSHVQAKGNDSVVSTISAKLFRKEDCLQSDVQVFLLESSYGADIVALCSCVEVGEVGISLNLNIPSATGAMSQK